MSMGDTDVEIKSLLLTITDIDRNSLRTIKAILIKAILRVCHSSC